MWVRSTAKAIIVHQGKVLLNRCQDQWNGEYYTLPGGGQEQYESLAQTLVRECREETGYIVRPQRFAALYEEICDDPQTRRDYPDYCHKMLHIFLCTLESEEREAPTEADCFQLDCQWVEVERLGEVTVLPEPLGRELSKILDGAPAMFLGTEHLEHGHA